jgi:hypothetical protein
MQERIDAQVGETLLSGGDVKLWMRADAHVRGGGTLDTSGDEVDEFVGIAGFCEVMPPDWLQVVDADQVKLPGFQEHYGTCANKIALTVKRFERHRDRTVAQRRIS